MNFQSTTKFVFFIFLINRRVYLDTQKFMTEIQTRAWASWCFLKLIPKTTIVPKHM